MHGNVSLIGNERSIFCCVSVVEGKREKEEEEEEEEEELR